MSADLGKFELLQELSEAQHDALAELLEERQLAAGDFVFRCGEEAAELFLIADGSIRLEIKRRELGVLRAGESIGAVSLAVVGNRQCDAVALESTSLLALNREGYLRLRADAPAVALALQEGILRSFAGFLRSTVADRRAAPAAGP
ncbi:MAG: cyclic nucleotide-binding domain-containing protein [Myxococcota bacterium]